MTNTDKATPKEFLQELWQTYLDKDEETLSTQAQTDYESIVRAVNSHEALLEACKEALRIIERDACQSVSIPKIKQAIEQAEMEG